MGTLIDRVQRELTTDESQKLQASTTLGVGCVQVSTQMSQASASQPTRRIAKNGFVLTPGRYVGTEEIEHDGEIFEGENDGLDQKASSSIGPSD